MISYLFTYRQTDIARCYVVIATEKDGGEITQCPGSCRVLCDDVGDECIE